MFNLLGQKINLSVALTMDENEFKGHFAPVFKSKIDEAWALIKKQKDASSSKSVEVDAEIKPIKRFEKKRDKGVHPETESTQSNLD